MQNIIFVISTLQETDSFFSFASGLKDKNINLDRKVLAHLAVHEPEAFKVVVEQTDR